MKKLIGGMVFACVVLTRVSVSAEGIKAESRIRAVTVYPDSALVTRSAQVKLPPGEQEILLGPVIPAIDENSLRVSGKGTTTLKLLGASLRREFLEEVPSEQIRQLKEKIQSLSDSGQALENTKQVLAEGKAFLDSIRLYSRDQLPRELVTRMPSAQELENTLKFLDVKLRDNYAQAMECDMKLRELARSMDAAQRELASLQGPSRKEQTFIAVKADAPKGGAFAVEVSYLARGASWTPVYDARADVAASEVELVSYAMVKQNTGEDWDGVEASLSTARPSLGGNLPYVAPWILRPFERLKAARALSSYDTFGNAAEKKQLQAFTEESASMPAETDYASSRETGTAVVYKINRAVTIKSDGSEDKVPVSEQKLKGDFLYSAYPRAVATAYLGSRVTNASGLQLRPGQMSIFLDGDYVGTSNLPGVSPSEEFDLYLGPDENVKVSRELLEKKVDETIIGNVPSPTKKSVFKYKLSVENYKTRKVTVKLFEAMPVSEDDRIKIRMGPVSVEPKEKDWQKRQGVWLWQLDLAPGAKQEIVYSFTAEHPRDMAVDGL